MKRLILLGVMLCFLVGIVNAENIECSHVIFNKGAPLPYSANLTCDVVADTYCPTDYGNWTSCEVNAISIDGLIKNRCFPLDPDCNKGHAMANAVDVTGFPSKTCPGEPFSVKVRMYKSVLGEGLSRAIMINSKGLAQDLQDCTTTALTDYCEVTLTDSDGVNPSISGEVDSNGKYNYGFIAMGLLDSWSNLSYRTGVIGPEVVINSPVASSVIADGNVVIDAKATCYQTVAAIRYVAYISKDAGGYYKKVDATDCSWCPPLDFSCGYVGEDFVTDGSNAVINWDASACDNKDFKLNVEAKVYESVPGNPIANCESEDRIFTLNNPNPGEPARPNVLNLIIAMVRSGI